MSACRAAAINQKGEVGEHRLFAWLLNLSLPKKEVAAARAKSMVVTVHISAISAFQVPQRPATPNSQQSVRLCKRITSL